MFMTVLNKWRRSDWERIVVRTGNKLKRLEASRADIDAELWPVDAQYLDREIDRLRNKKAKFLDKLKEADRVRV